MRRPQRSVLHVVLVLAGLGLSGCSPKPVIVGSSKEFQNLIFIAQAYIDAADGKLGRPPNNVDELKPFLEGMGDPNEILVSPNDGLPYVIVWGVKPGRSPIAYEQQGKDGQRIVVGSNLMPWRVTEEGFSRLRFPPGQKPPSTK
jgi:hypothetical protein